jgi:hypothetical protein
VARYLKSKARLADFGALRWLMFFQARFVVYRRLRAFKRWEMKIKNSKKTVPPFFLAGLVLKQNAVF